MKCIEINPALRTVKLIEVDISKSRLSGLQALVGGLVEVADRFQNGDDLLVNEEGLFAMPQHFFTLNDGDAATALAGVGLIVGTLSTDEGMEWISPTTGVEEVLRRVKFFTLPELRAAIGVA